MSTLSCILIRLHRYSLNHLVQSVISHQPIEIEPEHGVPIGPSRTDQLLSTSSTLSAKPSMLKPERKQTGESFENTQRTETQSEYLKKDFHHRKLVLVHDEDKNEAEIPEDDLPINDWIDDLLKLPASADEIFDSKKGIFH